MVEIKVKKIKQIAGRHKCGKLMEMRITDYRENEKDPTTTLGWMVFGVCKKCETVLMSAIFNQKEEPTLNVDFMIIDEVAKEADGDPFKELKKKAKN